jgi:hypothetical protein
MSKKRRKFGTSHLDKVWCGSNHPTFQAMDSKRPVVVTHNTNKHVHTGLAAFN